MWTDESRKCEQGCAGLENWTERVQESLKQGCAGPVNWTERVQESLTFKAGLCWPGELDCVSPGKFKSGLCWPGDRIR